LHDDEADYEQDSQWDVAEWQTSVSSPSSQLTGGSRFTGPIPPFPQQAYQTAHRVSGNKEVLSILLYRALHERGLRCAR
jgi:hypothetical protein